MDFSADFHRIASVKAESRNGHNWLRITSRSGCHIALHMEAHEAEALAEAWEDAQREPDLPTYDEALAAKCDADERYRRDMIDAGRGELLK